MTALGLDLSLAHTGVACGRDGQTGLIEPGADKRGPARLEEIRRQVANVVAGAKVEVAAVEGYAFASARAVALAELGGLIRWQLWATGVTFYEIAPTTLKKFALGKGRAVKSGMLAAAREQLGYDGWSEDEADALWLWAACRELIDQPAFKLTKLQRDALLPVLRKGPTPGRPGLPGKRGDDWRPMRTVRPSGGVL